MRLAVAFIISIRTTKLLARTVPTWSLCLGWCAVYQREILIVGRK
jgi:hypothetical protein